MAVDPIAEVQAIEHIRALKARYWRTVDAKQWDEWRQVFADDADFDLPGMEPRDVDEFVTLAAGFLDGALTIHHGGNPEIRVTGPDTAEGTWTFQDYIEWPPEDGARRGYRGWGRYTERYRREGGGWRISFMRIRFSRVDALEGPPVRVFEPLRGGVEPIAGAYLPQ